MTTPDLRSFTLRYPDGYEETVYYRSDATPDSLELAAELLNNAARDQLQARDENQAAGGSPDDRKPAETDAGDSETRPDQATDTVEEDQGIPERLQELLPDGPVQADVDQVDPAVLDRRLKDRDRKRAQRARKRAEREAAV